MKLLDEKRVVLIKHSWNYATSDKGGFGNSLCKMVVDISNDLKPLVKQLQAESQIRQIIYTVDKIVDSLPDFATIEAEVIAFVTQFSSKHITNEKYEVGVIALMMTLEKKVKSWTPEFREAWIFLFASIHLHFYNKVRVNLNLEKLIQRKKQLTNEK
jgi:hypothetical protein